MGIVTGISGPLWLAVIFEGHSGHAGAVPMNLRQDALAGASRVIYLFDEMLRKDPESPTVGYKMNLRNPGNGYFHSRSKGYETGKT